MPFIKIHIKGKLNPELADWFQGCAIESVSPEESCLTGELLDNSAIYGLLSTFSSLGITLISVSVSDTHSEGETIQSHR